MGLYEIDLSGRSFEIEAPTPEAAVRAAKKFVRDEDDNAALNAARSFFGQGLAFGFGDEIEAGARSLVGGGDYNDIVADIRDENAEYRRDNPVAAYGSELAGAAAPALIAALATGATGGAAAPAAAATGARLGSSGARLAAAIAANAGQGALAGAGYAEGDLADRARGAAMGGAIGGVVGGAAQMLPKLTPQAAKMLKEGYNLTPGQATQSTVQGAAPGIINKAEQIATSFPGVGPLVRGARQRSVKAFFKNNADDTLRIIGKELPEGLVDETAIVSAVQAGVNEGYDDLHRMLNVKGVGARLFADVSEEVFEGVDDGVASKVNQIVSKSLGHLPKKKSDQIRSIVRAASQGKPVKDLARQVPPSGAFDLSGAEIHTILNELNKKARDANMIGLSKSLRDFSKRLLALASEASGEAAVAKKAAVDTAYRSLKNIEAAVGTNFVDAPTVQKLAKETSKNLSGKFGRNEVIEGFLDKQSAAAGALYNHTANSGTNDRLGLLAALSGGGAAGFGVVNPQLLLGALAPMAPFAAYGTPATTAALRSATLAPGRIGTAMGGRFGALTQRNDEYGQ